MKQGNLKQARQMLEEISSDHVDVDEKAVKERVQTLLAQIEQTRNLRNNRRILVIIALTVFAVIATLISVRVPSAVIDIKIVCRRATFAIAENVAGEKNPVQIGPIAINRIDLYGAQEIDLSRVEIEATQSPDGKNRMAVSQLCAPILTHTHTNGQPDQWSFGLTSPYLRIESLRISEGSLVTFENDSLHPSTMRIIVDNGNINGVVDTGKFATIDCNSCSLTTGSNKIDVGKSPIQIVVGSGEPEFQANGYLKVAIQANLSPKSHLEDFRLNNRIKVRTLKFKLEQGDTDVESAVTGKGSIRLVSLAGKEIPIEAGNSVEIGGLRNFEIKEVSLGNDLTIHAYGEITSLMTGYRDYLVNRKPTWLEWLAVNHTIKLSIAALSSVFSVLLTVFSRLKILEDKK